MRRLEAADFYLFPQPYWDALLSLGERLVVFEAEEGGEMLASALCFATPPWLHYHLGATADRGRTLGASNLLFYEAACWAGDRGYERFHLGGGVGAREDSLQTFKRRFDPAAGLLEFAVGKAFTAGRLPELTGRDPGDLAASSRLSQAGLARSSRLVPDGRHVVAEVADEPGDRGRGDDEVVVAIAAPGTGRRRPAAASPSQASWAAARPVDGARRRARCWSREGQRGGARCRSGGHGGRPAAPGRGARPAAASGR